MFPGMRQEHRAKTKHEGSADVMKDTVIMK